MAVRRCFELRFFERGAPRVAPGVEVGAMRGQILDDGILADAYGGV